MKLKTLIGSLVLAAGLTGTTSLAQGLEPVPHHDTQPAPAKDSEPVRVPLEVVFTDPEPQDNEEHVDESFLPDLPILVDGKQYSAEEIREQDIHLAHYVLDGRSAELNVVQGFRTSEDLKRYLTETDQYPSEEPKGVQQSHCNPYSVFFEHAGYGGSYLTVSPGWGYSYVGNAWNDRISSIWGTQCGGWTLVSEHANFGGHWLWIGRGWAVGNLSNSGWYTGFWPFRRWHSWNDRISSLVVYW